MPLEQFEYIPNLVPTNPEGTDPFSQGDDHIRGIKETLLNTFPNFTGKPVTVTEDQIVNSALAGEVKMWPAAIAPDGYVLCDGASLSATTFPDLFAVLGYSYGGADDDFNVPDFTGRSPIGVGGSFDLGTALGAEEHTLIVDETPPHVHPLNPPVDQAGGGSANRWITGSTGNSVPYNTGSIGGGLPHNNLQPSLGINFIIRT